jgi:uncharacterized phage protein (TIGR01671 family)
MREIKFRAWDEDLREMFFMAKGDFHIGGRGANTFTAEWIQRLIQGGFVKNGVHKPKILMQYTGLKDKNGKEIFEGDIIRVISDDKDWNKSTDGIQVIEFWNGQFVFNAHRHKDDDYINFGWWVRSNGYSIVLHQLEVIGNIYENPELLEAK